MEQQKSFVTVQMGLQIEKNKKDWKRLTLRLFHPLQEWRHFFSPNVTRTRSGFILARKCVTPALSHSHCRTGHTQGTIGWCSEDVQTFVHVRHLKTMRWVMSPFIVLEVSQKVWIVPVKKTIFCFLKPYESKKREKFHLLQSLQWPQCTENCQIRALEFFFF